MPIPDWIRSSLGETRADILEQIRRGPATADELAEQLGLASNAIRSQLALLERDGFIDRAARHRATRGKPAHEYRLSAAAETRLSTAYAPAAAHLIATLRSRLPARELASLLRAAGRRLAARHPALHAPLRDRVDDAARALDELGGAFRVTGDEEHLTLTSAVCPLGAVTADHHEGCHLLAEFAGEVAAAPTHHRCAHQGRPRCIFEFMLDHAAPDASGHSGE